MTAPAHTPGPWKIRQVEDQWLITNSNGGSFQLIRKTKADAIEARDIENRVWREKKILDAAPDMLTALKAVDALWSNDAGLGFEQEMALPSPVGLAWNKIRAAIAKAEGRT